jgi:hypothetical protein
MLRALLLVFLILLAGPSQAQTIVHSDGFESGDASGWNGFSPGNTGYTQVLPHTGLWAGSQNHGNTCDDNAMWYKFVNVPGDIAVNVWVRIPVGFSFTDSDSCPQDNEWKFIIIETDPGTSRCFISFRNGSGASSPIQFICLNGNWLDTGADILADGNWHNVAAYLHRTASGGTLDFWYDNVLYQNGLPYGICTGSCPPISEIKVGAYINYPFTTEQTWYMDDVIVLPEIPTEWGLVAALPLLAWIHRRRKC